MSENTQKQIENAQRFNLIRNRLSAVFSTLFATQRNENYACVTPDEIFHSAEQTIKDKLEDLEKLKVQVLEEGGLVNSLETIIEALPDYGDKQ